MGWAKYEEDNRLATWERTAEKEYGFGDARQYFTNTRYMDSGKYGFQKNLKEKK